jgi:hypothetical protein
LRANHLKRIAHLLGAGETRFIDHVQMTAASIVSGLLTAAGKKGLQGIGGYSCLT